MLNQKQNEELQQVLNFTPYENLTTREKAIYLTAARNGYNLGMKHRKQIDRLESNQFSKEIVRVKYINKNHSNKITETGITIGNDIVDKVCDLYKLSKEDFVSIKRLTSIVQARSIAMNLIKEVLNVSYNSVSMFVGQRDHTTIIHHIRMKHKKEHLWQEGKRIWEDYNTIKESL
jgi:chromosomal replication initiation ATPase DnaA